MPGILCLYMGPFSNKLDLPIRDGTVRFVLNYPWSRSSHDSISQMLNRCLLETSLVYCYCLRLLAILYISMKTSYQSIVQVELPEPAILFN